MEGRLARLRGRLAEAGLDAFLVSIPENRRYLSGFTGSAGYLVISREAVFLCTDFRYVEQAGRQAPGFEVVRIGTSWEWLPRLLREAGAPRVGFEAAHVAVSTYKAWTEAVKGALGDGAVSLVATEGLVEGLRAVKEPEEVALIQRAVQIADEALEEVAPTLEVGETERAVAWRLERALRERGAEAVSFEVIVASGPNAALPHHNPSDRPIGAGEPVVIDFGARYGGYCSDVSRTFCLGPVPEQFRKVYDIVLAAQMTALATMQVGMTGAQADTLARQVIERAGYKENFGHSLGHGIGLAVHEGPRLGPGSETVLQEGMVFTVEPGVYISGWGGVRIEDTIVLEKGGARPLTRLPKHEDPRRARAR